MAYIRLVPQNKSDESKAVKFFRDEYRNTKQTENMLFNRVV